MTDLNPLNCIIELVPFSPNHSRPYILNYVVNIVGIEHTDASN